MLREAKELLDAASLNESDIGIIRDLHEYGFSAFVHGSLTKGKLRDGSDIDFALIGDFSNLPLSMRKEFILNVTDEQLDSMDYFSAGKVSASGRKMSLHIEKNEFREQYPDRAKPYAREYRSAINLKTTGASRYWLCGFTGEGTPHVFGATCPQEQFAHGVINTVPQTGIFFFDQESIVAQGDQKISIPAEYAGSKMGEKIMLLGLEFDKMRTDRALYREDVDRLVKLPVERATAMASEFLGKDARGSIDEAFALFEKYRDEHKRP